MAAKTKAKSSKAKAGKAPAAKKAKAPVKAKIAPKPKAAAVAKKPSGKPKAGKPITIKEPHRQMKPKGSVNADGKAPKDGAAPKAAAAPGQIRIAGSRSSASMKAPKSMAMLAQGAKPDSHGYVFINGRRVRMISTKGIVPTKKSRTRTATDAAERAAAAVAAKPVKTKLTPKELEEFQTLLTAKRAELVGDLSALEKQALQSSGGDLSHMPIHMADIGTDTYDQDFMLGMAAKDRELIREIDEALVRIRDGTYGVCLSTHKPIPKSRLNAKPWARFTIEAAREFEQGRGA